jgi:2-polyprenyl-3-methyl-5-hydroxy-6-metoxy-1,4-benzoquinol methylase
MNNNILQAYMKIEPQLNKMAVIYLLDFFCKNGVNVVNGSYTIEQFLEVFSVKNPYHKFIIYMMHVLEEFAFITKEGNKNHFCCTIDIAKKIREFKDLFAEYVEFRPLIDLVTTCAANYANVLNGSIPGVSIVYPGGDIAFLKPIVRIIEAVYDIDCQIDAIKDIVSSFDSACILEVGGGLGQITWKLMPTLVNKNINYMFTDISRFFMGQARLKAKAEGYNFMSFATYDISSDPVAQNIELKCYDLVIALNVMHAVPNIEETLLYLRSLLKEGGKIFISEHVHLPIWANLSWGVIEGWWLFDDKVRTILPTLSFTDWRELMLKLGFNNLSFIVKEKNYQSDCHSYLGIVAGKD